MMSGVDHFEFNRTTFPNLHVRSLLGQEEVVLGLVDEVPATVVALYQKVGADGAHQELGAHEWQPDVLQHLRSDNNNNNYNKINNNDDGDNSIFKSILQVSSCGCKGKTIKQHVASKLLALLCVRHKIIVVITEKES